MMLCVIARGYRLDGQTELQAADGAGSRSVVSYDRTLLRHHEDIVVFHLECGIAVPDATTRSSSRHPTRIFS